MNETKERTSVIRKRLTEEWDAIAEKDFAARRAFYKKIEDLPLTEWPFDCVEGACGDQEIVVRLEEGEDGAIKVFAPTDEEYEDFKDPSVLVAIIPEGAHQRDTLACVLFGGSMAISAYMIAKTVNEPDCTPEGIQCLLTPTYYGVREIMLQDVHAPFKKEEQP